MDKKIHLFYHVYADGEWVNPLSEYVEAIKKSSLVDYASTLQVGIVGSMENARKVMFTLDELDIDYRVCSHELVGWEQVTLEKVYETSLNQEGYVSYAHTKGAYEPSPFRDSWRGDMTFYNVYKWRECVRGLDDNDLAGCFWVDSIVYNGNKNFFAGNFWWANLSFIKSLGRPKKNSRFDAESWVGSRNWSRKICDVGPRWSGAGSVIDSLNRIGFFDKKIYHFYHCYADGRWKKALEEHVKALQESGLADNLDKFFIGIVGNRNRRKQVINYLKGTGIDFSVCAEEERGWEQVTQHVLYNFAQDNDGFVLYAHTKGTANVEVSPWELNQEDWRRKMTFYNVTHWRESISHLSNYDISGYNWLPDKLPEYSKHYSGNFWWTNLSYIKGLGPPNINDRWDAEMWIGSSTRDIEVFDWTKSKDVHGTKGECDGVI